MFTATQENTSHTPGSPAGPMPATSENLPIGLRPQDPDTEAPFARPWHSTSTPSGRTAPRLLLTNKARQVREIEARERLGY